MSYELGVSCLTSTEHLGLLAPLYHHLHEHQAFVSPRLGGALPARSATDAWARRRVAYIAWLDRPAGFALLAHLDGELVGYALGSVESGYDGWASADDAIGVLHDVVVVPEFRSSGVGSALIDAAEGQLAQHGVSAYRLNVIAANTDALRFYERRGMTTVTRVLLGRIAPADR